MDWVQIYTIAFLVLWLLGNGMALQKGTITERSLLGFVVVMTPLFGRIFNLW